MSSTRLSFAGMIWPLLSAALMFVLALASIKLVAFDGRVASLWLGNGAIITLLLRQPQASWPSLVSAAFLGNVAAALVIGDPLLMAAALALCNAAEILFVAYAFKWRHPRPVGQITLGIIALLALMGALGALLSTALAFASLGLVGGKLGLAAAAPWLLADLNGLLLITPLALSLTGPRSMRGTGDNREFALMLLAALGLCLLIFSFKASSMFLMAPVLVLSALRLGLRRTAILLAVVCIVAGTMTTYGNGPLHAPHIGSSTRIFLLQLFMSTAVLLTLPVVVLRMERASAAANLRSSEKDYRLLADHGSDLILRLDRNGYAEILSGAVQRLLGLSPAALAGPGLADRLHPDDRERFHSLLDESLRNGGASSCFRLCHADGQWRWVEADLRPPQDEPADTRLDCNPHADGNASFVLIASLRDIHQRRHAELLAEERLAHLRNTNRLLLMAEGLAALGHWTFDHRTGAIFLSPGAQKLVNLPPDALLGPDALCLVAQADRGLLLASVAQSRRIDGPVECTVRFNAPDGERTLQLRMQHTRTDGTGPDLFGVISDITDKLEAERKLVSALEDARTAADARSRFLATMSHEIRTPMTGVLGTIELLGDNPPPKQRQFYLDTMRQSADLLMSVLNDILDFSKIDAGQLSFAEEPFDLGHILRATVRLFDRPASARGLELRLEAPEPGEAWVRGDAQRLQQVLSNLLSNAIKFSERGAINVRCLVEPRPGDRSAVRLSVEDKGLGMSPQTQQHLFEPFIQGETAIGRGGTGLGLAITRRLVTGMGGTIAVRSALGRGSAFTVSLALPWAEPLPRVGKLLPVGAARSLDLLLVEDNPVNQLLVTAILKRMGHKVHCAADGLIAIDLAGERRFDLILMDMQMPRCDGLGATQRIRLGHGPNARTPIVALTADAASERRTLYTERGIDALLTKPVNCAALAATLDRLTGPADFASRATMPPLLPLDQDVLEEVRSLLGPARLDDLLDLLAAELQLRTAAIREALADRDPDRAAAEAHSLKGASSNLGARLVADAASNFEQAIRAANPAHHTDLGPALKSLSVAVERTEVALAAVRRQDMPLASTG